MRLLISRYYRSPYTNELLKRLEALVDEIHLPTDNRRVSVCKDAIDSATPLHEATPMVIARPVSDVPNNQHQRDAMMYQRADPKQLLDLYSSKVNCDTARETANEAEHVLKKQKIENEMVLEQQTHLIKMQSVKEIEESRVQSVKEMNKIERKIQYFKEQPGKEDLVARLEQQLLDL
jgi:hypothetical protein